MGSAMSMDYYSEEIFSLPASEVVASASAEGMTWALLSYLQEWCSSNSFSPQGVSVLVEVYRTLGCHANCWFLDQKFLLGGQSERDGKSNSTAALGLKIGVQIDEVTSRFDPPRAESLWAEREVLLTTLHGNPRSFAAWLHLVAKNTELEELLEAVWTLFVLKINAPDTLQVLAASKEQLDLIRVCGTSGGFWTFVAKDAFLSRVSEILTDNAASRAIADSIGNLFADSFGLSLGRDSLLRTFTWPK